jgi:RNA polymerase sigma-70 factor (ECF subfamily)
VHETALAERDLVIRALASDRGAFEALFALHGEALYRIAHAILQDRDDAEDALQEVAVKVLCGLKRFDANRPLLPWLRRIMVNECLSHLRRRRPTDPLTPDLPSVAQSPQLASEATEWQRRLGLALESLPSRQRAAMVLFGLDGLDLRSTAEAMGCSVGAVKSHVHHGRRKLAAELADLLSPEGQWT